MKQFTKNVIFKTAVYYTVIVVLFSFVMMWTFADADSISLDPFRTICVLPFCLCFAIANTTVKSEKIGAIAKWLIHFALTVLGAFIFLILPAELESSSGNFMGFILILASYIVCILIYALFSNRIKRTIQEDSKLKSSNKKKR